MPKFTGKGNYANSSLFLPAADFFRGTSYYCDGSYGLYWSSTLGSSTLGIGTLGRGLYFYGGNVIPQNDGNRYNGFSVRAVRAVSE